MDTKTISICFFRQNIDSLSREVRVTKNEVIVTRFSKPCFRIIPLEDHQKGVELGFMEVRSHIPEFLDLLEQFEYVFLTSHGKRKIACTKVIAII